MRHVYGQRHLCANANNVHHKTTWQRKAFLSRRITYWTPTIMIPTYCNTWHTGVSRTQEWNFFMEFTIILCLYVELQGQHDLVIDIIYFNTSAHNFNSWTRSNCVVSMYCIENAVSQERGNNHPHCSIEKTPYCDRLRNTLTSSLDEWTSQNLY